MTVILSHNKKINPLKPEFTIVISIHYKPLIAIAILVVDGDDLKNIVIIIIIKQFPEKSHCKTPWV